VGQVAVPRFENGRPGEVKTMKDDRGTQELAPCWLEAMEQAFEKTPNGKHVNVWYDIDGDDVQDWLNKPKSER